MTPKDYRVSERRCPWCNANANGMADMPDGTVTRPPEPGDVTICIECVGVGVFTEDGLRKPKPAERAELAADPRVLKAQQAIRRLHEMRRQVQ